MSQTCGAVAEDRVRDCHFGVPVTMWRGAEKIKWRYSVVKTKFGLRPCRNISVLASGQLKREITTSDQHVKIIFQSPSMQLRIKGMDNKCPSATCPCCWVSIGLAWYAASAGHLKELHDMSIAQVFSVNVIYVLRLLIVGAFWLRTLYFKGDPHRTWRIPSGTK